MLSSLLLFAEVAKNTAKSSHKFLINAHLTEALYVCIAEDQHEDVGPLTELW